MKRLADIAEEINAHLKRFEGSPQINVDTGAGRPYYHAHAYAGKSDHYVRIQYRSYQLMHRLRRPQAEQYLQWLNEGNVGTHSDVPN